MAKLSPTAAFAGTGLAFGSLYLAAGAPTPLLVLFERDWGFPAWELTVAFAAYAFGLLAALLVVGELSDFVGRRPVLVTALVVELAAMLMFVFAPGIGWVIAARVVQGVATGAASSAFTAALVELAPERHKRLGAIIASVAPAGGLGLGALLTGIAVQVSHEANLIVFTTLAVIMVAGTLVAAASAETVTARRGAVRSLAPTVTVPPPARREFRAAFPVHLASWMLAGLFMGLAPTIVRDLFHIDSGLVNGVTAFLEPGAAAVAAVLPRNATPRRTLRFGSAAVLVGTTVAVTGIAAGLLPLVWAAGSSPGPASAPRSPVRSGRSARSPRRISAPACSPPCSSSRTCPSASR